MDFDDENLVEHFAERHGFTREEAQRALKELGPARAEAMAAARVLRSYLDGKLDADPDPGMADRSG